MKKFLLIIVTVIIGVSFLTGCDATMQRSKDDVNDIGNIENNKIANSQGEKDSSSDSSLNIIDKLPQEQQQSELDTALAAIRKLNKEGTTQNADGTMISMTQNGGQLVGQSKNIPDWSKESEQSSLQRATAIIEYLGKELKIPQPEYGYYSWTCLDPRMNAIYDSEDKGVAAGYKNENIYIEEYETEVADVYSYLILVRESNTSEWKVLHQGNSYSITS